MAAKKLKQLVTSIPVIGYGLRVVYNFVASPRQQHRILAGQVRLENTVTTVQKGQVAQFDQLSDSLNQLNDKLSRLRLLQDNLQQQFSILEAAKKDMSGAKKAIQRNSELFASDHILDNFYTAFEDRFRGDEVIIEERLVEYLPYFKKSKINFKQKPVLDIGSGRGELLQLLAKHDIDAIGLDINYGMVERSQKKGLRAVQGDALEFLHQAKSQSYGAITGFHIVEHIPFNVLLRIFTEAHRVLAEDGFVLFETPNPENVVVGSDTFHMDPSHLHPLPPALLAFTIETCGFRNVEIKRLHPDEQLEVAAKLPEAVAARLFGPRDYAVNAYK